MVSLDDVVEAAIEYGRSQAILDFLPDEDNLHMKYYLHQANVLHETKKAYTADDDVDIDK